MKHRHLLIMLSFGLLANSARADLDFDAGADLRIRQEIMHNIPSNPGYVRDGMRYAGRAGSSRTWPYTNWIRFRVRAWGEVKGVAVDESQWRLHFRLADESRWYVQPSARHPYSFPDELIFDNLFLEGKGLFNGFFDFTIGRQDMYHLYGLDHIFNDATPGDGSRTAYTDMIRTAFHFDDDRWLDVFALYDFDDADDFRWGTKAGKHRSLTGLGGADPDMDDWGFGAIWNDKLAENVPYQAFIMQKDTASYDHPKYGKCPWTQRNLLGAKVVPRLDEEWSLQFEAMGQIGEDGTGNTLCGASSYAGFNWKSSRAGIKPFVTIGYLFMSGDENTAEENGGNRTFDPMWARGANESEMFLYGTLYGVCWWSNMHYFKNTVGLDLGRRHSVSVTIAPIWAAAQDELGGDDGNFKGLQTFLRYDFPLLAPGTPSGNDFGTSHRGFEIWGHVLAEYFNPGDYYESDKPAYFLRWQVEVKF